MATVTEAPVVFAILEVQVELKVQGRFRSQLLAELLRHFGGPGTYVYIYIYTWTSKMAKILDPILPILSMLGYWANIWVFWRSRHVCPSRTG